MLTIMCIILAHSPLHTQFYKERRKDSNEKKEFITVAGSGAGSDLPAPTSVNAATMTQAEGVESLLRWARFTQADADAVGGWVELAYYVDLVLDTDNFDPDAPCPTAYYNTLRLRANNLSRQNRISKIPVHPFVKINAQPEGLVPDRGEAAILSVDASASNGTVLSYQWYACTDADKTNAAPITGATEATFAPPTDDFGTAYYFCRLSGADMETMDTDAVCVDIPALKFENGLAQPVLTYTDAATLNYTNEGSDIVRFCVYVETDYDTDSDGKLDLIKAVVQLPRAAMEGVYDAAVIYEARPYCAGTQSSLTDKGSGTYDIDQLYSTAEPRVPAGTATTEELVDAAQAADFYFYENLDWYDYFLVRGFAVVVSAGPGTRGSEGFETCGSDLEIDAFACVIEWLTGDRVAYTDKTSNIAIEADWCNEQVGTTGRSYAGTTQFGLATTGVEGLETIVPVGGIASWYEYSCSQGMNLRSAAYTNNLAYYCASRAPDSSDWPSISSAHLKYLGQLDKDEENLNGSYGEHWRIRDYTLNAANIQCPALIVHGLNDNNVRTKNFQMMYDAYQTAGADVKLLLFQDGHVTPAYGKNKTEQFINGEAYQDVLNRWLTYHLYDIDNGANDMAAVTVQDNVDGSWDTYDNWESEKSMTMSFTSGVTISNYSSSDISSSNYVTKYTAGDTTYSTVEIIDITEDVTITGTIKVTVTATPQTSGNNQMLTAFLVDMSNTAFNAYNAADGYKDAYHTATGEIFDVGGGAESYTVVKLKPSSVKRKIIASGWIDLANPSAGFSSASAWETGKSATTEQTYTIYLQPNLYTVKAGHQLALVVCTRDPSIRSYRNNTTSYSVLISNAEAVIPVY